MLHAVVQGAATGAPPLVIAHGLFGSARNWGVVAKRLSEGRRVIAVDMRNHGDSPRDARHDYEALAADLAEVIAAEGGRADILGHSMGGKAAMALALSAPALVRRLIVADIAPVCYDHSHLPLVAAMQAVDLSAVARRSDADAALAPAVPEPALRAFLMQSLSTADTPAVWKLNLAVLADQMALICGFPELPGVFDGPTLFVTGERSDYVLPDHWQAIRRMFPGARHEVIPGAGHWIHAEAPLPFIAAVNRFLDAPS